MSPAIDSAVYNLQAMGTLTLLTRLVIACLCVKKSHTLCSDGVDENVNGIYGQDTILSCRASSTCNSIQWQNNTKEAFVSLEDTAHTSVRGQGRKSFLNISTLTFYDDGSYECWCYGSDGNLQHRSAICSVTLTTICQARVIVNGATFFYNSTSRTNYVNVTMGTRIKITCHEGGESESNCQNVRRRDSGEFTYRFNVLSGHDSCYIECRLGSESGDSCTVHFTLNITILETSTQPLITSTAASTIPSQSSANKNALTVTSTTNITSAPTADATVSAQPSVKQSTFTTILNDKSISATAHTTMPVVEQKETGNAVTNKSRPFPVMLLIGISIVVFVGVLFIICFVIYFSRSTSSSRSKKTQNLGNESSDTNIPIGPTYATVNKSSTVCSKDDDDSERVIPCTDDAYAEVNSDMKEESSTQQVNAIKAETPITKDYYSVVNTSNTNLEPMDHENESDSALYTEVNKGVKQAGKKVGTFSPESSDCNPNIPDVQSYEVLEQPESSEYDAVGASPALYAVVDKERKKE